MEDTFILSHNIYGYTAHSNFELEFSIMFLCILKMLFHC